MLVCSNCGSKQETGKFCGSCGADALKSDAHFPNVDDNQPMVNKQTHDEIVASTQEDIPEVSGHQSNIDVQETVQITKKAVGQYWNYFLHILKNPTRAFSLGSDYFLYGLIAMGLYALTISLSLYFFGNSYYRKFGSFWGGPSNLPFFEINFSATLLISVFIAIIFVSTLTVVIIGKIKMDIKTFTSQFGALFVPFLALNIVALFGGIIGSSLLVMLPLLLSISLLFIFIPVLFIYEKMSERDNPGQKFYLSLLTVIFIALLNLILSEVIIINLLDKLDQILSAF